MSEERSRWNVRKILFRALLWTPVGFLILLLVVPLFTGPISWNHANARDTNTAFNVKIAISTFFTEYRNFPLQFEPGDLTIPTDQTLMTILCSPDHHIAERTNPRRITFFTGREARFSDRKYRNGLQITDSDEILVWDSYGNHFMVRMDTDADNQIADPENQTENIQEAIVVWSAGPDGDFSTWQDNIKTW